MNWFDATDKLLRYDYRPGKGPCLVLLHEMGGSIESWDLVMEELPTDLAVLRPEMRGMGVSQKISEIPTFGEIAADILALIDHVGVTGPVILSGCAIGGGVVVQFALDYPERTAAILPLDPALSSTPEGAKGALALADRMEAEGVRGVEDAILAKTYPDRYRDRHPEHFAAVRGRWLANDPHSFAAFFRMLTRTDLFPRLAEIRCPVHFGAGLHDTFRPPEYVHRVAAAIPGSVVTELDAGHHVPDQAPAEVATMLTEMAHRFAETERV